MAYTRMIPLTASTDWEYSAAVDTTSTGRTLEIVIPNNADKIRITYKGTSTASVTIASTTSTQAEIIAGTAVWVTSGTASTGGTAQALDFVVPPCAVALQVGTALAGVQGYISISATGK